MLYSVCKFSFLSFVFLLRADPAPRVWGVLDADVSQEGPEDLEEHSTGGHVASPGACTSWFERSVLSLWFEKSAVEPAFFGQYLNFPLNFGTRRFRGSRRCRHAKPSCIRVHIIQVHGVCAAGGVGWNSSFFSLLSFTAGQKHPRGSSRIPFRNNSHHLRRRRLHLY